MARVEVFVTAGNDVDGNVIAERLRLTGFEQLEQRTATAGDTVVVAAADVATVRKALGLFALLSGVTIAERIEDFGDTSPTS
jgi:hypothetical protein